MKVLAALFALLMTAPVAAEVVAMQPPVVVICGNPASIPALTSCLKQHLLIPTQIGSAAGPANEPGGARLFSISVIDAPHRELQSVALFLEDVKGHWRIGGLTELDGERGEVLLTRFEKIGPAKHRGYRFDLTLVRASTFSPDDVTSAPSVYREARASLCAGDSYGCATLTQSCQNFVNGQLYSGWQGSLDITGDNVVLSGVGTTPACSQPGRWTLPQLGFHL
ncbi:hypothetical protein BH11MYX1_BH11MYX1_18130 [soil metagenome]